MRNVALGDDSGTQSAKVLGSERRVAMFAPDSGGQVVILQLPNALPRLDIEDIAPPTLPALPEETPHKLEGEQ